MNYRCLAALGAIGAGGLALLAGFATLLTWGLYSWDVCSCDGWNALIVAVGAGALTTLAVAAIACTYYAVSAQGSRVIKVSLPAGLALFVVGFALLSSNPTLDDESSPPGPRNCYDSVG